MHEILFQQTDDKVKKLIGLLKKTINGTLFEGKVYIVGGALRNSFLGLPIHDIDIVVNIEGGGIAFANFFCKMSKCFIENENPVIYKNTSTAKFQLHQSEVFKDIIIECSQTRKEFLHNSTKDVFGTLEEDSKLRDLTINSLYYDISNDRLIDYNSSIDDIKNMVIRTPNIPDKIYEADPLRILRAIKYSCHYGWGIARDTWLGMVKNAHLISTVAQERITSELSEMLVMDNPSKFIIKMYNCGILDEVLPDIYGIKSVFESKDLNVTTFDHTMLVLDNVQPLLEHRLAALYHDVGKILFERDKTIDIDTFSAEVASHDLKMMKFSRKTIKSVEKAIQYHRHFDKYADGTLPSDKKIRKFLNNIGDNLAVVADLMNANNNHCVYGKKKRQVLDILNRIEELEDAEKAANVKLPINGNDIQQYFSIKPSPVVGIALEKVKDAYFENPNMTKDEALEIVEKLLKTIY